MYARRSDSRTTIGAAVAVAIAAQVTPGSAAAKPRAPSSFLEKFGFQGAQLLLGDEQAEVALRGTLKLAHLGTPAAQRRLASVVAGRGAQWSGGIWLALVRALFASNGAADGLHVSLRRTLTEHIRTERVGNGKQLQLGLLSQSCAARGLATSRSTEDRRVLDEVIRGGGNGAKIVKRALGAEDESQPLSRRQALAGSGRRRDTLELLGELKGTQAPLAAEALLGSADPGIDELLARGQLGQSAWARRLQMARAIVNGQGLPTISTETGKRAGGEWSSSEREEIGQWAAAWNDKTWGMNALRSNDPRQIARLASKVNWLSQEVLDEAARRLELLPEEPLRTMLGFSLANGRAAALLSSHTLVELAHEGQNLRDLAFRELSRRVNTRLYPRVWGALGNENAVLRAHVVAGLGLSASPVARRLLRERYSVEARPVVRGAILREMRNWSDPWSRRTILTASRLDPEPSIRNEARNRRLSEALPQGLQSTFLWRRIVPVASSKQKWVIVHLPVSVGLELPVVAAPGSVVTLPRVAREGPVVGSK